MWSPTKESIEQSNLSDFIKFLGKDFTTYKQIHQWSLNKEFWASLIKYFKIDYSGSLTPINSKISFIDYPWFPNVKLNFAENLLKNGKSESTAINFIHESGKNKKFSYNDLWQETRRVQSFLVENNFKKGDVLGAYMPNIPETVFSMLGCTSLGGTFTSTSCDFGLQGVLDRFEQSCPKILIMPVSYSYNGKSIDMTELCYTLESKLTSVEKIILVDFLDSLSLSQREGLKKDGFVFYDELTLPDGPLDFQEVQFGDPLYIMYSSGTTGRPKCIVHSTGGTLTQHMKELKLHVDLKDDEKILFFTTCGWMMWNWLVSALAVGSEVILYEGSPAFPDLNAFMEIIDQQEVNVWGTSPKFLRALEVQSWNRKGLRFPKLRSILSTGAPLLSEQFDYIDGQIKEGVQVSSISGGTDIIACFMLGNPMTPVIRGRIQGPGLGMDIGCFDSNGNDQVNEVGELVCKNPFVSQPIGFLNDQKNEKFQNAYFRFFEGVWHHGDFIKIYDDQSIEVLGRSDATLNPGGVRIGTGEIYRQTEKLSFIVDSICVGKNNDSGDLDIALFVKANTKLDDQKIKKIKEIIRSNTTNRHVPKFIFQVKDIPYTRSGKKMEIIISKIINEQKDISLEAVANPECLKEYETIFN
jgi:acetoacetyl-CoA synthetase